MRWVQPEWLWQARCNRYVERSMHGERIRMLQPGLPSGIGCAWNFPFQLRSVPPARPQCGRRSRRDRRFESAKCVPRPRDLSKDDGIGERRLVIPTAIVIPADAGIQLGPRLRGDDEGDVIPVGDVIPAYAGIQLGPRFRGDDIPQRSLFRNGRHSRIRGNPGWVPAFAGTTKERGRRKSGDDNPYGMQPWAMMAATRFWNSGLATNCWRTFSRVLAEVAISLIQKSTPGRSPPRLRNAL